MKRITFTLLVMCCLLLPTQAQNVAQGSITTDSVLQNIATQVLMLPQEKVYVQTDKPYYINGEKIFFRAFLLNALTHQPSNLSRYVYLELIDPVNKVAIRKMIRPDRFMHYGAIEIPEDLPQGNYQLRAYTRFMTNGSDDYFYSQPIYIADPHVLTVNTETNFNFLNDKQVEVSIRFVNSEFGTAILPKEIPMQLNDEKVKELKPDESGWVHARFNLPTDKTERTLYVEAEVNYRLFGQYIPIPFPKEKIDMSFYPEGGSLLEGVTSRVGFKVLNSNGNAEKVSGTIVDNNGQDVAAFSVAHEGMGFFQLQPEAGKTYTARCEYNGETVTFALPAAQKNGYALATADMRDKLRISVNATSKPINETLYLLIHTRGDVNFLAPWDNTQESIVLEKLMLPSGVNHLMLFNDRFEPLSERLIFTLHNDWLTADLTTDKDVYGQRDHIRMGIAVSPETDNEIFEGSLAISVTDDSQIEQGTLPSILTQALLVSELQGNIKDPGFYFTDKRSATVAADLLMLTHGWRRYDLTKAIQGDFTLPEVMPEQMQTLTGLVKGGLAARPYANADITVMAANNFATTKTGEDGRFRLDGFEFPDSTAYIVQAMSKSGMKNVELILDQESFPAVTPRWWAADLPEQDAFLGFVKNADEQYLSVNGMRMINLEEVVVKGSRFSDERYRSPNYAIADQSLNESQIENAKASTMQDLLSRIPGVISTRSQTRARHSFAQAPLIVVNGMMMNLGVHSDDERSSDAEVASILDNIDPSTVGRIDVLYRSTNLVTYNRYGTYGVIEIFLKDPSMFISKKNFNVGNVTPQGYSWSPEFYSPIYDTPEAKRNAVPDLRSTIYWKPDVLLDEEGKAAVDFYSNDHQATYTVIVEGITPDGRLIYTRADGLVNTKK